MFIRIVRMSFEENKVDEFRANFDRNKSGIRSFPGCLHLELLRDRSDPSVFFTYSKWENEESLEDYRKSELFQKVWSRTKKLFDDKPMAWSVDQVDQVQ